jgi:hypothetical protein
MALKLFASARNLHVPRESTTYTSSPRKLVVSMGIASLIGMSPLKQRSTGAVESVSFLVFCEGMRLWVYFCFAERLVRVRGIGGRSTL